MALTLELEVNPESLASYSTDDASWILEPGEYVVRISNSSRNTQVAAVLELDKKRIVRIVSNLFKDDCKYEVLCRPEESGNCVSGRLFNKGDETIPYRINITDIKLEESRTIYSNMPEIIEKSFKNVTFDDVKTGIRTPEELVGCMADDELAALCVGNGMESMLGSSVIGAAGLSVPGAAGETSSKLCDKYGIPNMVLSDGPAGLRLDREFEVDEAGNLIQSDNKLAIFFGTSEKEIKEPVSKTKYYQYCTAIPIATLLSQTWDTEIIEEAGDLVGIEMEEYGVKLWLAPGMNIQRNPLCGRNFEYFSEDPMLTGKCASAMTMGVQSHKGCGVTIKHLACNNQEDNRYHNNSHITERALREIYLKGFEIAVRESKPYAIMTSYNLINGLHTANNHDLLTKTVRDEWGFEGLIMTDWGTTEGGASFPGIKPTEHKYPSSIASGCIAAGNNLIMPGSNADIDDILKKLDKQDIKEFPINKAQLQTAALNILKVMLRE